MPKFPPNVVTEPIPGLELLSRGKVRDTYALPDETDRLLVRASDRISIFEFVLPEFVPQKGEILTAMNTFWRSEVLGRQFVHDLITAGSDIDNFLPPSLRNNLELQKRAVVVKKLKMLECEAIVRGCLTGSGIKSYEKTGRVCGHPLPHNLQDGDQLPYPIFTPSTKAVEGHDEHISADSVAEKYGPRIERLSLQLFTLAQTYALKHGIILADTKLEWGDYPNAGLALGDEVLTPDSSRFWDVSAWQATQAKSRHRSPPSYDKQFVREWGKIHGINERDPLNPDDVAFVHGLQVPDEVIQRTTQIYRYIFWRLTGMKLEAFQREQMGIEVKPPVVKIEVISGSESDLGQMEAGLQVLRRAQIEGMAEVRRHVISCHRNPADLARYVSHNLPDDVVVMAGAGMAAALPGMLKALLILEGKSRIPVIGVAFAGKTDEDNQAACLSIERLPGQPVLLDPNGKAYFGPLGFENACLAALNHEFLPTDPPASKPALFDLPIP